MMARPETRREICSVNSVIWEMIPTKFGGSCVTLSSGYPGKSVTGARCHLIVLALTMTLTSTTNSSSIFQRDGKLKSGIYKIYNIFHDAYC